MSEYIEVVIHVYQLNILRNKLREGVLMNNPFEVFSDVNIVCRFSGQNMS